MSYAPRCVPSAPFRAPSPVCRALPPNPATPNNEIILTHENQIREYFVIFALKLS